MFVRCRQKHHGRRLATLSLWLVTLAKAHPFTFLEHSLRYGDSLVGLTRQQMIGFHWEPGKQKQFGEDLIQKRLDRATESRAKILNAREDVAYRDQESRLAQADEALTTTAANFRCTMAIAIRFGVTQSCSGPRSHVRSVTGRSTCSCKDRCSCSQSTECCRHRTGLPFSFV